jgi:hypothetical protein
VAPFLALLHIRRRLRGIRRRSGLALRSSFPNPKQREAIVGYTQTVGSIGGIMATAGYYLAVTYGHALPEVRGGHEGVALHADVGPHPGAAADPGSSVSARVANLEAEEGRPAR